MKKMRPEEFSSLYDRHEAYWDERRSEMRRLRHAYLMRFWERAGAYDENLLIETSRAYELVESYVASLFVRDPSVVVKPDIHGHGTPELAAAVANLWLRKSRTSVEDALRLALIYPFAGLKLSVGMSSNVLNRVTVSAVSPWDIIVDDTASNWDEQRYCGHRYYLSLEDAKERYGNKKFSPRTYSRYIEIIDEDIADAIDTPPNSGFPVEHRERFVMVVEVFDLRNGKMYAWSPDWKRDKWLYSGVELPTGVEGEETEKFDDIPFKTVSGSYRLPIVPLFLSREPDCPMRGYSSLRRVYDQLVEVNNIRTFQAQGVRRAARMLVTVRGLLDEEAKAKYAQGQDGEVIEVGLSPGQSVSDIMQPIPHNPVPAELQRYAEIVDDDFSRGSVIAPFTRGEATQATATEIQALAAYTASEIGRMARARDACITGIAESYLVMLGTLIGEDKDLIAIEGGVQVLEADDVLGEFDLYAEDSGNTPMSEVVRKQELERLLPMLQALGVPNEDLLRLLIRSFELPADIAVAPPPMEQPTAAGAATGAPGPVGDGSVPPEMMAGMQGGPARVEAALPEGGVV